MHYVQVTGSIEKPLTASSTTSAMVRISPFVGVASGSVAWLFACQLPESQVYNIASALATLTGTGLGFLLTALSIFTALVSEDLVKRMQKTGHYKQLVQEMLIAGCAFMFAAVSAVICLFVSDNAAAVFASISAGLAMMALVVLATAGHKFYLVLMHIRG